MIMAKHGWAQSRSEPRPRRSAHGRIRCDISHSAGGHTKPSSAREKLRVLELAGGEGQFVKPKPLVAR